jgi:predicted unusual protein kinase regulating ubiquinone biosynthesis (AarF/ABC1/UbiB family)
MMGRLEPMERVALVLMALGISAQSTMGIVLAADLVAKGGISADDGLNRAVTRDIDGILSRRGHHFSDILATLEGVFEALIRRGVSLPVNLLMFKKAQFTLKGVLSAIDPAFERDQYLIWAAAATFVRDFAQLRYQKMVMAAAWELHRHSLRRLFKLQKQLLVLFRETSLRLLNMPFQVLDGALVQAQLAYVPLPTDTHRAASLRIRR